MPMELFLNRHVLRLILTNTFIFRPNTDKEAVEKRLFVLQKQGHNIYTKTNDFFT